MLSVLLGNVRAQTSPISSCIATQNWVKGNQRELTSLLKKLIEVSQALILFCAFQAGHWHLDLTRFHSLQMQFFKRMERYFQVCFSGTMVVEKNINASSNFSFNNCILLTLTERRVFVFINTIRRIVSMVCTTVGFLASAVGSSSTVVLLPFFGQRFYCCLFRIIRILTPTLCYVWIPLVHYQLGVDSFEVFLTWAGIRSFILSCYVSGVIGARARVCVCASSGQITTCHFRMVQLLL